MEGTFILANNIDPLIKEYIAILPYPVAPPTKGTIDFSIIPEGYTQALMTRRDKPQENNLHFHMDITSMLSLTLS